MADFSETMVNICSTVVPAAESSDQSWTGTALVVGAGGIGRAVADELSRRFPDLSVLTCGRKGPPDQALQVDLEDDASLERFMSELESRGDRLRLLFNCSGRLHGPELQPEKRL